MVDACSRRLFCKERARTETAAAMYRLVIPVLLYLGAVTGAPQDPNRTEETYVKIEPVNEKTFQNLTNDSSVSSQPVEESENYDYDRNVRSDDVTASSQLDESQATTEIAEYVTEIDEPVVQPVTEVKKQTQSASPRFYSKLSYFQKPDLVSGASLINLVERNGKRKFKSRCRCEKIWNCPKLQITVPRCPDEYFLCCF